MSKAYNFAPFLWAVCLILAVILLGPPFPIHGQEAHPSSNAQRVDLTGRLGGPVLSVIPLSDGTALTAEGSSLLRVDLNRQTSPVLARLDLAHGSILDLAQAAPLYYALTEQGMTVLLDTGQTLPVAVNFVPGGGQVMDAREGTVAIACREAGLRLLTIGAQGQIFSDQTFPLPGGAYDIVLTPDGTRAYVAAGASGIHIIDLSTPASPRLIATLPDVIPAQAIAQAGALLAVSNGRQIFAVDPALSPAGIIGTYTPLNQGRRMVVQGEFAYIADSADGLKIIWLAAPDRPVQVYGESDRPTTALWLDADTAYLVGPDSLRILDVSNRYRPLQIAQLALQGQPLDVTAEGGRVFVALTSGGVAVIDTTNLAAPSLMRRIPLDAPVNALLYHGGMLYAALGDEGLAIIDASQRGDEVLVTAVSLPGQALDLDRRGNALYVAAGEAGLLALDITRPITPILIGGLPSSTGQAVLSVTLAGKRAYLAEGDGFTVADINRPDRMGRLAHVSVPVQHIGIGGTYLYALSGDQIAIYDIRATAEPVYLRTYAALRQINRLTASGHQVFVTAEGNGPDVVALSLIAPDRPFETDSVGSTGFTSLARPDSNTVWLARGYAGLTRYQLSEGGALIPLASYTPFTEAARLTGNSIYLATAGNLTINAEGASLVRDLVLDDETAAVAAGEAGIMLYTLDSAGNPRLFARRQTVGPAAGVALDDRFVYVADAGGLSIFDRLYLEPVARVSAPAPAANVALRGGTAYLSLTDGSLAVIDVSDPTGGIQTLSAITTSRPTDLIPAPARGVIYGLADTTVTRIRASDPGSLAVLQTGYLPLPAERGFFLNSLLAVSSEGDPLRFYDLTYLEQNVIPRGSLSPMGEEVIINGRTAYIAFGEGGLGLLSLDSPGAVTVLLPEEVHSLYRNEDILFALGTSLTAWNITSPANPSLLTTLPLAFPGRHLDAAPDGSLLLSLEGGVSVVRWNGQAFDHVTSLITAGPVDRAVQFGSRLYLALHQGGLLAADISDPTDPVSLFTYTSPLGRFVHDLLPLDAQTLLVSWEGGIEALDLSTPTHAPRLLSVTPAGRSQALDLALSPSGTLAALAHGEEGVTLFSLEDALSPQVIGYTDTPGEALRAVLDNATLYVADGQCGLRIIELTDPASPHETGYWRTGYASDVTLSADGTSIYVADAGQLLALHYDPAAPSVPPPVPQTPDPADGQSDVPLTPRLTWGPPPDPCDPLTYEVFLGPSEDPPFIGQVSGDTVLEIGPLEPLRTYAWRVEVVDRQGDRIRGPLWHFTTARASLEDLLPPAPPPFIEPLRRHPLILVILAGALITVVGGGLYLARRRRRRSRPDIPEWFISE